MPTIVKIKPNNVSPRPLVVVLAYDGLCTFEFGIAVEVFGLDRPEMGPNWYRFAIASVGKVPIRARGGFTLKVKNDLSVLSRASLVIIPGWGDEGRARIPTELIRSLQKLHQRGATIAAICGGAYVVAGAGLLDGKRATTHWRFTADFSERYPAVALVPDVLYVDEGQVITSAGSAAGIDMCLHIVRRDFGAEAANRVARRLVMPAHRTGGQAQFVERPVLPDAEGQRLGKLLNMLRQELAAPHTIQSMAAIAGMSVRTFARRFTECMGQTPMEWLIAERLALARGMLEAGATNIESVAEASGLGSAATMRHHFRRQFGISPANYRLSFARERG